MTDIETTLRLRLDSCGCKQPTTPPCGGCVHDLRTLNAILYLRQSLKDIAANHYNEPMSAQYAQDALDGTVNA